LHAGTVAPSNTESLGERKADRKPVSQESRQESLEPQGMVGMRWWLDDDTGAGEGKRKKEKT
jgi:hypothetical protein